MWDEDIQDYCLSRGKDPKKVSGILLRKGWDPNIYTADMKSKLFDFLDKWYTLSIKQLPKPATLRRNPVTQNYRHKTVLPGGWVVETVFEGDQYVTQMRRNSRVFVDLVDSSIMEAEETHLRCIEDLLHD